MKSSAPLPERRPAHVAVFAKAPVPGSVKTRLAPLLGAQAAARLHESLVRQALATAVRARLGAVELWCAPDASHPFFIQCARDSGATLHVQHGADLGARMGHAFARAHAAGRSLVLIGADCPALEVADLLDAAAALEAHDAVLVPAEDGGYVLVGLARAAPIFDAMAWGGPGVMAATRDRLRAAGLRWKEMRTLWDVDRPEDYARLQGAGLALS